MHSNSDGCLTSLIKIVIIIVIFGGGVIAIFKSCVTQTKLKLTNDFISVAKETKVEGFGKTYDNFFTMAFNDGEWKQYDDRKTDGYPAVTYTADFIDVDGSNKEIKYVFSFSDTSGEFQAVPISCTIDNTPSTIIDGLGIAMQLYVAQSPVGQAMGAMVE